MSKRALHIGIAGGCSVGKGLRKALNALEHETIEIKTVELPKTDDTKDRKTKVVLPGAIGALTAYEPAKALKPSLAIDAHPNGKKASKRRRSKGDRRKNRNNRY